MKVVYIAGPYSGPTSWAREQNIRAAEVASMDVIRAGHAPVCVHTMARFWFGEITEAVALASDIAILRRCDAVLLLPGWEKSSGTLGEIEIAKEHKIPTFESVADLEGWAA